MHDTPSIAALTRRLAETPSEFLDVNRVDVEAVVSDLIRDLGGAWFDARRAAPFANDPRRRAAILIASWLLHDEWFREQRQFAEAAYQFLRSGLDEVSAIVEPSQFVSDPDRREELARRALRALQVVPAGESAQQASDRLATLDSIERVKVLRDTRAAQKRIAEIQEAMRKKAAEEAAAAYGRE